MFRVSNVWSVLLHCASDTRETGTENEHSFSVAVTFFIRCTHRFQSQEFTEGILYICKDFSILISMYQNCFPSLRILKQQQYEIMHCVPLEVTGRNSWFCHWLTAKQVGFLFVSSMIYTFHPIYENRVCALKKVESKKTQFHWSRWKFWRKGQ